VQKKIKGYPPNTIENTICSSRCPKVFNLRERREEEGGEEKTKTKTITYSGTVAPLLPSKRPKRRQ